ncbi:hypothetical protein [Cecembia rubra]|uniref:Lipoprotein n=1 Tax=Cecembia rubra TaxID=1485585 RepID=A0A2P8DW30_9BACT|nr:hypothetical protein [Cecembia rubra]PSL01426.1 hypothetical protein CLV48_11319 [Cecembia rubra]
MKNSKRNLKRIAVLFVVITGLLGYSCSEKDDSDFNNPETQAKLSAEAATASNSAENNNERVIVAGFATSEFHVGTKDVEMKYAARADILAGINIGNISLKTNANAGLHTSSTSRKKVTLISNGQMRTSTVGEGSTPRGNYMEVTFRLFKNTEVSSSDPLYDKSLAITGEVEGKAAEIWFNSEKMIRAKAESAQGVEVDGQTEMVLVFDMEKLFANVNFATATSATSTGKIEIGPNSTGANALLYSQIESNLESAVVLKKK